jgi:histone H3/H4
MPTRVIVRPKKAAAAVEKKTKTVKSDPVEVEKKDTTTTDATTTAVVKPRKPRRFRAHTNALRNIRKQQRRTDRSMRRGPFRAILRQTVFEKDMGAFLRVSACNASQEITEDFMVRVLRAAFDRRLDSLTPAKQKLQINPQVSERNIEQAFYAMTDSLPGDFEGAYKNALHALGCKPLHGR